jgi:MFS transporter, DHA2 family, multidrug resistance protein
MSDLHSTRLAGCQFLLFNLVLGLAHMVVLFNAGSYVALLPHAAGNLGGVLPSFGTWAQTDFLMALALAFPIARMLSCRFGETRVFIGAFVVYAGASLFCVIGDTITTFLPSRILLGLAGGLTLPLGQTMLLREYPDRLKSMGLAIWGLFTMMPFTLGLATGGWIADELGWRALFALNIPCALMIAGFTAALLHGRPFEPQRERLDLAGFFLLVVIFGGIQTILNQGNDFDWFDAPILRATLGIVIIAIPVWIIWELGERQPAVDLRLFTHRNFAIGLICLGLGFLSIQGLLALFVVQLQMLMGYSSSPRRHGVSPHDPLGPADDRGHARSRKTLGCASVGLPQQSRLRGHVLLDRFV